MVEICAGHAHDLLAGLAQTLQDYLTRAVLYLEREVVCRDRFVVPLLAVLALVSLALVEDLLLALGARQVVHLAVHVLRREDKRDVSMKVGIERPASEHFIVLLAVLSELADK